jgi:hypothetical protein
VITGFPGSPLRVDRGMTSLSWIAGLVPIASKLYVLVNNIAIDQK